MLVYTTKAAKKLIELARQAIRSEFTGKKIKVLEDKKLREKRGVFVTLKKKGELRGCIGFPEPVMPLNKAVVQAAKYAAFSDPRFPPLKKEELGKIKIEISILTKPKICKPEDVEIGEDGLICEYKRYYGLLLPQVATEHKMSREEFIEAVCMKAGLSRDAWGKPDFKLYKFRAQIFEETGSGVVEKSL